MSRKITTSSLEFTDAPYLVGTVVRVAENNYLSLRSCHEKQRLQIVSLLMLHIWLVRLFASWKITT